MKTIVINSKKHGIHEVFVDDEDYELVSKYKWGIFRNNYIYYAESYKLRKDLKIRHMHNLILNRRMIDHIDGNGLNNQRNNLRPCTDSQNGMNKRKRTMASSIYKGVHYEKARNKWRACLRINGKLIRIGRYETELEAAQAYNNAAIKYFGDFKLLNALP